jgi:hypothetical protein
VFNAYSNIELHGIKGPMPQEYLFSATITKGICWWNLVFSGFFSASLYYFKFKLKESKLHLKQRKLRKILFYTLPLHHCTVQYSVQLNTRF